MINERIKKLRMLMKKNNIQAYIIPTSDYHQSEYVADFFKSRAWISGFTGSAGIVVITKESSGLWTDGRYFIQAEKQLKNSEIKLFKMNEPEVPTYEEWLLKELKEGDTIGFDAKCFSIEQVKKLKDKIKYKKLKVYAEKDLINEIWINRPKLPQENIFIHNIKYAGKSFKEKLIEVKRNMKDFDYYILSSLDDIAWLFNLRGNDVKNNPVFLAYSIISKEETYLFIDKNKLDNTVYNYLNENKIIIKKYDEIYTFINSLEKNKRYIFDLQKTNYKIYLSLNKPEKILEEKNITTYLKAIKNNIEIKNIKKCHIKDGVAMVKFLYWIEKNINKEKITEISATEKLESFRKEQEDFFEISFDTIAAYKDHAAMMHYKAEENTQYELKNEGFFLVDSGGQYFDGTTDITRTISLGNLTNEEMYDYTLTLKGNLSLSKIKFLYGTTGSNLDILARQPLWNEGIDYKCGTGHGVGYFLNVHEGPQQFRPIPNTIVLEPGMIITNEPGVYKEGKHGIRIENELLVVEDKETEFGKFLKFEIITYCPIDLKGVKTSMLSSEEINYLNDYHEEVYKKLSPFLNEEEKKWLKEKTEPIGEKNE
ncbi:Xaa-Pro aminopeptidase [Tepiditoga spiralis]|uniref:Xaa-Pro aminopeptidase n=1 Tax=Tepiditoga spiralis TaxID=2108365 RepID=A0A7G1GC31_9BACT|nr:aminopeptidase P family protein [Tepiditoga spiralis]BBE31669.1 Xaa-Pro aminopeptidase [Tepiditoga spiralis]